MQATDESDLLVGLGGKDAGCNVDCEWIPRALQRPERG